MAGCGRPFDPGLCAVPLSTSHRCARRGFLCIAGALDYLGLEGIAVPDFGFAPRSGIHHYGYRHFSAGCNEKPILNLDCLLIGLVLLRLTFFIQGLQIGLFPIGENMVAALTRKGSLF